MTHKIPLLIFSAGLSSKDSVAAILFTFVTMVSLTDMIVEVFKQKATLHENIRVVSNDMIFTNVS